jgi:TRAP transporter TAXI family solute receptor
MFGRLLVTLFAAFVTSLGFGSAQAQGQLQTVAPVPSANADRANAGTIGIISGGADGTYIRIAADLANVLDGDTLRILPIIGRGSLQNLQDIMFLRGVDIGIVQMDARQGLTPSTLQASAQQRLRYIARLYNEELHVLASRDITTLRQLDGKKVNIDKPGSGTNLTARLIFEKSGIKPQFTEYDQATSYERLRSGELQAALYVAGRPVRAMSEFQGEGRFHLLSVPFEGEVAETYLPARFASSDYPRLIDSGKVVETVAVGNVLAVFNWAENSDRYKRVQRFVDAFFSRFDDFLQPGRHPKWKEVNLAATIPGWQRFKAAQDWLDRETRQASPKAQEQLFNQFVDAQGSKSTQLSPADRERLFQEFLKWQEGRGKKSAGAVP